MDWFGQNSFCTELKEGWKNCINRANPALRFISRGCEKMDIRFSRRREIEAGSAQSKGSSFFPCR